MGGTEQTKTRRKSASKKTSKKTKKTASKAKEPRVMPEGKPWKKGQSGNPGGRPALPPEVRQMRDFNTQEFIRICSELFFLKGEELLQIIQNKENETAIKAMVASIILHGINKGDQARLSMLLDRTIGKAPDYLVMKGTVETKKTIEINMNMLKDDKTRKAAVDFANMAMRTQLMEIKKDG